MKLYKKLKFNAVLELKSGMHIGDSGDNAGIGGVDHPVVRRKDNNQPYIPGSSLKGKIRSLLEIAEGSNGTSRFRKDDYAPNSVIPELFGSAGKDSLPSRILFRDANMTDVSARQLGDSEFTQLPFAEVKFENVINRIKGTAENMRQIERVPAGTKFGIEIIINVMADSPEDAEKKEKAFKQTLKKGIALLHDDYIGGSGSRGYGQVEVKFQPEIMQVEGKTPEAYEA